MAAVEQGHITDPLDELCAGGTNQRADRIVPVRSIGATDVDFE